MYARRLSTILAITLTAAFARSEASNNSRRADATVIVMVSGTGSQRVGNGFVIGDGSLVVTARHVLLGNSHPGAGEQMGLIVLLSPFLGDASEAKLIAEVPDLDVAVLKANWKQHPALEFASQQDELSASKMDVVSRIPLIAALMEDNLDGVAAAETQCESETLPIDFVGVRGGEARLANLTATARLRAGWSGSPIFIDGTDHVAGGLSALSGVGPIAGVDATSASAYLHMPIVEEINRIGEGKALAHGEAMLRPKDADDAFKLLLEARVLLTIHHPQEALVRFKHLMESRHESVPQLCWAAAASLDALNVADAEECYRKAIKLDPASILAPAMYAQFLVGQKRADEAQTILENLCKSEPKSSVGPMGLANLLSGQNKQDEVIRVSSSAVQSWPKDARFWAMLGQAQKKTDHPADAVTSFRKAIALDDSEPGFRIMLAMSLVDAKQLDEAETEFRSITKAMPQSAVAHFLLGNFLANNRPLNSEEAASEIEAALACPASKDAPPHDVLEKILQRLRGSGATTKPAFP